MTLPTCHTCAHQFSLGESAFVEEWTVITPEGATLESRYFCEPCKAAPDAGLSLARSIADAAAARAGGVS